MSRKQDETRLVYSQTSGRISVVGPDANIPIGRGYSGQPPYVNQPGAQALVARGPIPRGIYRLVGPCDTIRLGPVVYYLDPSPDNNMYGRSGFFIHGDNAFGNQTASHGCIILHRKVREKIADVSKLMLEVVE